MSTSKQHIFSATAFMKYVFEHQYIHKTLKAVNVYFLRDKVLTRTQDNISGWSDRPRKSEEYFFKPILITCIDQKGKKEHLDIKDVDTDFGEDWGIKFKKSLSCALKTVHNVNMLEISAEKTTSPDGFEYYPAKTLLFKKHIKAYDKLNDENKDMPAFAFRKANEGFDDEENDDEESDL